jgi:hypothetical protein
MQATRCVRPGVKIAAGRGDVVVSQRRLYLGQRGAAVDSMRAVRVAQPVRRYSFEAEPEA